MISLFFVWRTIFYFTYIKHITVLQTLISVQTLVTVILLTNSFSRYAAFETTKPTAKQLIKPTT
jgi:uncharacterized MAPEG superfamily protein